MAKNNIFKKITGMSPIAKLGLVGGGLALGVIVMTNTGGTTQQTQFVQSGAALPPPPKEKQIDKVGVGEKYDVPEDSILVKKKKEGEAKKIEEIREDKESSSSYIDQLVIEKNQNIEKIKKKEIVDNKISSIEDILREKRRKKLEAEEAEKKKQQALKKIEPKKEAPVVVEQKVEQVGPTRRELINAFVKSEVEASKGIAEKVGGVLANIESDVAQVKDIYVSGGESAGQQTENGSDSNNQDNGFAPIDDTITPENPSQQDFDVLTAETFYAVLTTSINSDSPRTSFGTNR